jgi:DNA-binding winged helix-turn-helix (wHTH) protein
MTEHKYFVFTFADVEVREREFCIVKAGQLLPVEPKAFRVLLFLLRSPHRLITKDELLAAVWSDCAVSDNSLARSIALIRRLLGDDTHEPRYIATVPTVGYRFLYDVTVAEDGFTASNVASPAPPMGPSAEKPARSASLRPQPRSVIAALTIASVLAATGIATVAWLRQHPEPALREARLMSSYGWIPALSRDGKLLAYTSVVGVRPPRILVQQTAGGNAIPVTSGSSPEGAPDFSPDGTHIAFYSVREGGGIYITPTLPGEPRLLVGTPDVEAPRFSPSGDRILYLQYQKAFTVSVDSAKPVPLPINQDFRLYGPPFWSPNGNEILFYGLRRHEQQKPPDWWIAPLTAGEPRPAHLPRAQENYLPAYAVRAWVRLHDSREWIVYSTANLESWKLWRVRVSPRGAIEGNPELLSSGNGKLAPGGSVSEDGKLVYKHQELRQIDIPDFNQRWRPEAWSYRPVTSRRGRHLQLSLRLTRRKVDGVRQ